MLDGLVARKLPKVAVHLGRLGTSASALAGGWYASAFTTTLPAEAAARLLDALLLEGSKVLHRAALALLKTFETSVLAAGHPGQLAKVLDARASVLDGGPLLALAFKGLGPLPGSTVAGLRARAAAQVDAALEAQRARLAALVCRTQ